MNQSRERIFGSTQPGVQEPEEPHRHGPDYEDFPGEDEPEEPGEEEPDDDDVHPFPIHSPVK